MHNLEHFNLGDMAICTGAIRRLGTSSNSFEDLARNIVDYFYEHLVRNNSNDSACALVRLFRTRPYGNLSPELKSCADAAFQADLCFPLMKCLVLEASRGELPDWNGVAGSKNHRAIPLPSEELVKQMPMISKLIEDFGLRVKDLFDSPADILIGRSEEDYNIFHIPDAVGSAYIPAQEGFVIPHGVKSVIGFGGKMTSGNIFAVVLFSKVKISEDITQMFRCLALATNLAAMRFDEAPVVTKTKVKREIRRKTGGDT
jgi:hypothetical protein